VADDINERGDLFLQDRYVLRSQVASLISTNQPRWQQTPDRAETSRQLVNGEIKAPIPDGFKIAGADQFRADSPHKYLVPYHQRNTLAKDPPRVKRWRRGDSDDLKLESTKIEQRMQAVMDDRFRFRDAVDILLMEGVCLSISLPSTARPSRSGISGTSRASRGQRASKKTASRGGSARRPAQKSTRPTCATPSRSASPSITSCSGRPRSSRSSAQDSCSTP
jgi:hypothetical protein